MTLHSWGTSWDRVQFWFLITLQNQPNVLDRKKYIQWWHVLYHPPFHVFHTHKYVPHSVSFQVWWIKAFHFLKLYYNAAHSWGNILNYSHLKTSMECHLNQTIQFITPLIPIKWSWSVLKHNSLSCINTQCMEFYFLLLLLFLIFLLVSIIWLWPRLWLNFIQSLQPLRPLWVKLL